MNCPACGADNRDGAKFCRMCGEQISKRAQAPALGTATDSPVEESVAGAQGATAGDKDAKPKEHAETVATDYGPPVAGIPGVLFGDLEEEFKDAAEGEPGELIEIPAGGGAPGIEPVSDVRTAEQPSEDVEVDADLVGGELEQPVPGDAPAVESPDAEVSDGPVQPTSLLQSEAGEGEVEASVVQEADATPEKSVSQTASIETPSEADVVDRVVETSDQFEGEGASPMSVRSEQLMPLAPGAVIGGRFQIVGSLDDEHDETLYLAHDILRCWQCGFQDNKADDAFCAQCGASLEHRAQVRLLEVQGEEAEPSRGEAVAARISHEGRHFLLLAESEVSASGESGSSAPDMSRGIRLVVGYDSDAGQVRELDEDSLLALTLAPTYESRTSPVLGLFAVADGMGGHEGGEVASRIALQVLADAVLRNIVLPVLAGNDLQEEDVIARLRQATVKANDAVYLARQKRGNDMGTTLTTALIKDDRLFLAHVGDCRAYRWSADGLQQLTTDHSLVASMIASGQAAREEIYTHPHRSVIYRCVGDQPEVEVDTDVVRLIPGDRLVVCCDGLWEMVRDEGIQDVMMQEADPQAACELLVNHANAAGGDDNISVIIVQVALVG